MEVSPDKWWTIKEERELACGRTKQVKVIPEQGSLIARFTS